MKSNPSKTDIIIFSKIRDPNPIIKTVQIAGNAIKSQQTMKVLGINFDHNLSWESHIRQDNKKANSKLSVLKKVRKYFTKEQFIKILTTQLFSTFYYCSPIWLPSSTKQQLWKIVNSAHYQALRLVVYDFRRKINREKLDV